jgi:hypothetical protein
VFIIFSLGYEFDGFYLFGFSRKMRLKRVVRIPAISLKMADIPPDDYSWRKYGQKPIKGSPHPRYAQRFHSVFYLTLQSFISMLH